MIRELNKKMIDIVAGGTCFCLCFETNGRAHDEGGALNPTVCAANCAFYPNLDHSICTDVPNAPVKKRKILNIDTTGVACDLFDSKS